MKKIILPLLLIIIGISAQAQLSKWKNFASDIYTGNNSEIIYLGFKDEHQVKQSEVMEFLSLVMFEGKPGYSLKLFKEERDQIGFTHTRYKISYNNYELEGKIVIAHCKDGKLVSVNGDLNEGRSVSVNYSLTEEQALNYALKKVNAKKYKWENLEEERLMQQMFQNPDFTFQPKGQKVLFDKNGQLVSAYKFNIYAEEPLYKADVFVDAITGSILFEHNQICTADVPASAATKYSGTQTLTCDQNAGIYRLREAARGNGIETYNLKTSTNYASAVDFTNTTTSWTTTGNDQAATDAHWGAEMTYDYYFTKHNRNSIDNNGYKLLSYVHYSTSYNNAFWDGTRMTYGDGNGTTFTILTGLDVCGHEITHGLTSNTSNLNYSNESGALNESYSDIFGTVIENFGRPTNWNWKIGTDITPSGNGIRNMQNPNQFSHPDTYMGTYYYTGTNDNGGVHTNSGVSNYWFYLLTAGATGTNDISNSFTVTGIGMNSAANIAYRALTYYYTPSTNFANARALSIQAAKDLFGACSNEVVQTTNAWYAVGVGTAYSPATINPNFTANTTTICNLPAQVAFNNTTSNGVNYTWDFGDNSVSTSTNPAHTYSANGTYTVKLKATGCMSSIDSIIKPSFITVNAPSSPVTSGASVCQSGVMTLSATGGANLKWYSNSSLTNLVNTGNTYVTPSLSNTTTYYVVNTLPNSPVYGGIPSNINGGYLTNPAQYLIFDVIESGTLQSVVVYANSTGNRVIELRNSSNVVLNSSTVNLATGANTVTLNYPLTPGTNYQLGLNGSSASNLYRTNASTAFPYNIGGCVSITNSSAGSAYYYWYYNWKIQKADCKSMAATVTATVNAAPSIQFNVATTNVCRVGGPVNLSATPGGGTFTGTGVTGNTFDPSVGTGTYAVYYNVTGGNGCNGMDSIVFNVSECTNLAQNQNLVNSLGVYPNPAKDQINVMNAFIQGANTTVELHDALGKLVLSSKIQSSKEAINISKLPAGIYLMTIRQDQQRLKTIKVIKE